MVIWPACTGQRLWPAQGYPLPPCRVVGAILVEALVLFNLQGEQKGLFFLPVLLCPVFRSLFPFGLRLLGLLALCSQAGHGACQGLFAIAVAAGLFRLCRVLIPGLFQLGLALCL